MKKLFTLVKPANKKIKKVVLREFAIDMSLFVGIVGMLVMGVVMFV